jgi:AraC-like DNA-binding protein
LIARSAIGAETLEVAMHRIALTFGLLQDDLTLDVMSDGKLSGLALRFVDQDIVRPNFLHELLLRVFWRMLAWLAGGTLPAERFDFAFECPSYANSYARIFPSSLQFGQPQTAFWFETSRLQRSVRRDEVALQAFIADMQTILIVPRGTDEVIARVRSHLHHAQPAWPDLTETARALAMSGSTLQRRLAIEGTSFQSVKDELRRDLAIVRLNTSAVPLAALADELGFANSAAFQRAFKSWTGSPPGSYRRSGPA